MGTAINGFGLLTILLWLFFLWQNIREAKRLKTKYKLSQWPSLHVIRGIGTEESKKDYQRLKRRANVQFIFWNVFLIGGFLALMVFGAFFHKTD